MILMERITRKHMVRTAITISKLAWTTCIFTGIVTSHTSIMVAASSHKLGQLATAIGSIMCRATAKSFRMMLMGHSSSSNINMSSSSSSSSSHPALDGECSNLVLASPSSPVQVQMTPDRMDAVRKWPASGTRTGVEACSRVDLGWAGVHPPYPIPTTGDRGPSPSTALLQTICLGPPGLAQQACCRVLHTQPTIINTMHTCQRACQASSTLRDSRTSGRMVG